MYQNLEIIKKIAHKENSVRETKISLVKNLTNAPITVAEFLKLVKNYPILFAKDKNNDWFASNNVRL